MSTERGCIKGPVKQGFTLWKSMPSAPMLRLHQRISFVTRSVRVGLTHCYDHNRDQRCVRILLPSDVRFERRADGVQRRGRRRQTTIRSWLRCEPDPTNNHGVGQAVNCTLSECARQSRMCRRRTGKAVGKSRQKLGCCRKSLRVVGSGPNLHGRHRVRRAKHLPR